MSYLWLSLNGIARIIIASVIIIVFLFSDQLYVEGHGRLMDPPARNCMWRYGFANPVNYDDDGLYCGGYTVQWDQNDGKCGICGDAYHMDTPRPHEAGGTYGRGIISRHYFSGQQIDVEIELTTNHKGRFELYLCPNNNPRYEATQSCFDRYPLYVSGTRDVRYLIPPDSRRKQTFLYRVRLPPYLTCSQCVLQWTYYTGNMWGKCANGTEGLACGRPETFRNCADISIVSTAAGLPPQFVNIFSAISHQFYADYRLSAGPQLTHTNVVRSRFCLSNDRYRIIPGIDNWCETSCMSYPPVCPEHICTCPEECEATGALAGVSGADEHCQDQCLVYGGKCPETECICY